MRIVTGTVMFLVCAAAAFMFLQKRIFNHRRQK